MICLNIWWYSETLYSSHENKCHINLEECLHTTMLQIEVTPSSCLPKDYYFIRYYLLLPRKLSIVSFWKHLRMLVL